MNVEIKELSLSQFKQVKIKMLTTGQFDQNLLEQMSDKQRYWVNETKKTLRDLNN